MMHGQKNIKERTAVHTVKIKHLKGFFLSLSFNQQSTGYSIS